MDSLFFFQDIRPASPAGATAQVICILITFAHIIFKSLVSAWYWESRTLMGEIYGLSPPINTIIHGCVACVTLMEIAFNWVFFFFSSSKSLASFSWSISGSSSVTSTHAVCQHRGSPSVALRGLQAVCLLIQMESHRKCLFFKCNLQSRFESLFKRPKMNIFKIVSILMVTYYRQRFPWTIIRGFFLYQ